MPSTTELMSTELGKAFVEAREKANRTNVSYRKNEIGEDVVVAFNPYKLSKKYPYANIIAKEFDKMVEKTIPQNEVLSAQFESWINHEKNDLMVDSRINKSNYFKSFNTGEVSGKNSMNSNDVLKAQMDLLSQEIKKVEKAFTTFMTNSAEKAFANKETLEKYSEYYKSQLEKVNQRLEKGDFSAYDKKDKDGNVVEQGTLNDAKEHKTNIDNLISKVSEAKERQNQKETSVGVAEATEDYVGDNMKKLHRA